MVPMFPACTGTPKVRAYVIASVPDWAQLADFPPSAVITHAGTNAGKYEPKFHIGFQADKQEIQAWLLASPGIEGVIPEVRENKINGIEYLEYDVLSEENRNIAVVGLSPSREEVFIRPGDNSQREPRQFRDTDNLD